MTFKDTRRSITTTTVALFVAAVLVYMGQQSALARERILLDAGWRFQLANEGAPVHSVAVTQWVWTAGRTDQKDAEPASPPAVSPEWKKTTIGEDVFHNSVGFSWFSATLPSGPWKRPVIRFWAIDDNATVWLNGRKLIRHTGWNDPFNVPLADAWKLGGPNVVSVLVENTGGPGGIVSPVEVGDGKPSLGDPSRSGFDDTRWRVVHLPHDYVVEGKFTQGADAGHGSLPLRAAWYRKSFTIPASDRGKSVWIDFDGVYRDAKVYLNGTMLGEHQSGYTGFRYDIGKSVHFGGLNELAMSVNPRQTEGWWYEGGGIYRHVWLNIANPVHVAPWGCYASAQTSGPESSPTSAIVTIKTTIANDSAHAASYNVASVIVDDTGRDVGRITTASKPIAAGSSAEVKQEVDVRFPRLWSIGTPRLYKVKTTILAPLTTSPLFGKELDSVETPFGIRTIRFDANKGFFLNGKHVEIQGVCNHQDFAGVGIGMSDSVLYWRVKKLKEMGCNAYRMSHNPPAAELLDACDKLGMLVMDENRHLGDTYNSKTGTGTPYSDLSDLKSMIQRDRNHPSIIMWSLCNEEGLQETQEGANIFKAMMDVVHEYDTTRPISCAMNGGWGQGITHVEDLQGINYSPWVYDKFHKEHPSMPMYGSETSSDTSTRGEYTTDAKRGYVTAYDTYAPSWAQTAEVAWKSIADRPFIAGGFVWTGFDYKGEPTPYGWPCVNSHFGIMDICGFPKDNYFYYQSVWGSKPMVHLLPHWNWHGKEGQPIDVWAYSNADKVELLLNGKSLGAKTMPRHEHVAWKVPYTPGTLVARGYRKGKLIATDKIETTGPPTALRLTTDRTKLIPDGEDVTMVAVSVVDAQGRVVPTAGNQVMFRVSGAGSIAGVGNGDPSDHDPDKASTRRAFNGLCMVLVGTGEKAGDIRLTASAAGLKGASMRLVAR